MTHKHFIAAILAAAVTLTALSPAQARAGNNTAEIVAGVAALAIIGAAISEASRDKDVYVTRNAYPRRGHGWQTHRRQVRQERMRRHWRQHHRHQNRHHRNDRRDRRHGHGGHR